MQFLTSVFQAIQTFLGLPLTSLADALPWMDIVWALVYFVGAAILFIANVVILVWLERRVAGFFQERVGPNRVGPFGLFQTLNDAVKLLGKETIIPAAADKVIYLIAPLIIFTVSLTMYGLLPYGPGITPVRLNVGILFFLAVSSTTTIGVLMAGWGSNNKYSLLGGMRTVAQIISYEIPMALSIIGIIMLSGSLDLGEISKAQQGLWFVFIQPIAFVIFVISALAELTRSPFDMTEAEQEFVAGYHTEYSGMRFALFFMAEYANLFSMAALGVVLFFGGAQGPILPPWLWFLIKTYAFILFLLWIRWTVLRIRVDKMMKFNWKVLIPVSLANLLLTGVGIKIYQYVTGAWRW
jgi:NADH-quinone oxidoreductase subunit H